ncbi:MAG TPA: CoA-binding protein [Dehalococcoidia bacterium]|nr:CoA-binding protein [Dehalococcoidia bacterium]
MTTTDAAASPRIAPERLRRALQPRTAVVVGSKRADGYMWLRNYSTFTGELASVQIDPAEIPGIEALGVKNYTSLLDVPFDIDYVMLAVPRTVAPRVLADCAKKGAGAVALFTSGFAETGEDEGIRLQAELLRIAREGDVALIGPNCMGLYNRKLGIRQSAEQGAGEAGDVGFISQSGTHGINFGLVGEQHGVRVSTSVSIGNAIVLDVPDYLDYLRDDPDTKVIAMYIEGVKDGRRFVESLRRAAQAKPVVVWKGGVTDAGARATQSHTGSLATSAAVFDALLRQCGALSADSLEDTIDVVKALLYAKPGTGRRMGLMAMTGGQSVVITDAFVRAGLEVPRLGDESYAQLREFFNIIGGSYQNPLDMGGTIGFGGSAQTLRKLFDILDADPHVDAVAMEMAAGFLARRWQADPASLDALLDTLVEHRERSAKPFVLILQPQHVEDVVATARRRMQERGLAVFASFERAARALARAIDYHRFRAGLD